MKIEIDRSIKNIFQIRNSIIPLTKLTKICNFSRTTQQKQEFINIVCYYCVIKKQKNNTEM